MKIAAIVSSDGAGKSIRSAYATEPPLTAAILDYLFVGRKPAREVFY